MQQQTNPTECKTHLYFVKPPVPGAIEIVYISHESAAVEMPQSLYLRYLQSREGAKSSKTRIDMVRFDEAPNDNDERKEGHVPRSPHHWMTMPQPLVLLLSREYNRQLPTVPLLLPSSTHARIRY